MRVSLNNKEQTSNVFDSIRRLPSNSVRQFALLFSHTRGDSLETAGRPASWLVSLDSARRVMIGLMSTITVRSRNKHF